jgi:hypothetical protein
LNLADLRKLSIKRQYRIHFRLQNGMECVVTEHGTAQVPGLAGVPGFNLETELAAAREFLLEPAQGPTGPGGPGGAGGKDAPRPRTVSREELDALSTGSAGSGAPAHDEHDGE